MTAERKVTVTVTSPDQHGLRVQDLRDLVALLPPGMGAPLVVPVMGERGSQRDPEPYLRGLTVVYDPQADAGAPLLHKTCRCPHRLQRGLTITNHDATCDLA